MDRWSGPTLGPRRTWQTCNVRPWLILTRESQRILTAPALTCEECLDSIVNNEVGKAPGIRLKVSLNPGVFQSSKRSLRAINSAADSEHLHIFVSEAFSEHREKVLLRSSPPDNDNFRHVWDHLAQRFQMILRTNEFRLACCWNR